MARAETEDKPPTADLVERFGRLGGVQMVSKPIDSA
jgi:hypothetical protein